MRRIGLILLAATTAAAAGCGGGGGGASSGSAGSKSSSPAQFRSQVAQICTEGQQKINSVPKPKSATAIVPYINKTLAIAKPYVGKLSAVKPPDQLSDQYQQVVSLNHQEIALLTKTKNALSSNGNPGQVVAQFQKQANALSSSENAKWRQLGVEKCAS
jgi:hypothetical protein